MKTTLCLSFLTVGLLAVCLFADLPAASVAVTWTRWESSAAIPGVYAAGGTLTISNGTALVSAAVGTNVPAVPQDLTGLGGRIVMGGMVQNGTNITQAFAISTLTATAGTFTATLTLPAFSNIVGAADGAALLPLQLSITNSIGGRYVYPGLKMLNIFRPLGE